MFRSGNSTYHRLNLSLIPQGSIQESPLQLYRAHWAGKAENKSEDDDYGFTSTLCQVGGCDSEVLALYSENLKCAKA